MSDRIPPKSPGEPGAAAQHEPPRFDAPVLDANEGFDLKEFVALLRRRWKLVTAVTIAIFAVAVFMVGRSPAQYRAEAVIRLQDERGALTRSIDGAAIDQLTGKSEDPLLSQLQVLRSRRVAAAVVDSLGLRLQPEPGPLSPLDLQAVHVGDPGLSDTLQLRFRAGTFTAARGGTRVTGQYGEVIDVGGIRFTVGRNPGVASAIVRVVPQASLERWVMSGIVADPRPSTDVVDIRFTSTDPEMAADIVNAVVDEFRRQNANAARQQARMRRVFIEEQLAATDAVLADLQLALTRFREENQLFSSRELLAAQQAALFQLQIRREELAVDREIYGELLRQLEEASGEGRALRTLVASQGLAIDPVIGSLYGQLVRYESAIDSLTAGSWSTATTHPDVERLRSLIQSTRRQLAQAVNSHVAALDARIAALDDLRRRNAAELAALPPTEAEEARLVQQLQSVQHVAEQLRVEHQRARMAEAVEVGQVEVVDRAVVPSLPIGSGRSRSLALGLMLGVGLGIAAAILRERLDQTLSGKDDVERLLRLPAIGVIPQTPSANGRHARFSFVGRRASSNGRTARLVTAIDRNSLSSEAYRTLRTNLIFSRAIADFHRIVVTSTAAGEGKTTIATNLAVTLAQQGMKVALVDCDLRRPSVHNVFDLPREPGLTDRLIGRASSASVARPTSVNNLTVIPCGSIPPNPSELLGGGAMEALLDELGSTFDIVLIDTPPLLGAADAAVLAAEADGVLLVIRAGSTDRRGAETALRQLHYVDARVLGAVLNDPDANLPKYGERYHYMYYNSQT